MRTIPLTELNEAIFVRREFGVAGAMDNYHTPRCSYRGDGNTCCAVGRMITDEEWNMLLKYIEENEEVAECDIYDTAEEKTPGEIVAILTSLGQPAPPYTNTQLNILQKFHDDNYANLDDDGEGTLTSLPDYLDKTIKDNEFRSENSMSYYGIDYATARLKAAKELLKIWEEEQK